MRRASGDEQDLAVFDKAKAHHISDLMFMHLLQFANQKNKKKVCSVLA